MGVERTRRRSRAIKRGSCTMTHAGKETAIRDIRGRLRRRARDLSAFLRNQSGATFVAVAIASPVLIGMAALGFDTTIWYMTKRQIQTVADNAALVGIIELSRADSSFFTDLERASRGLDLGE